MHHNINLLSGNLERYLGRLLCTKNGNPDWDSERSYRSLPAICAARCQGCLLYTSDAADE